MTNDAFSDLSMRHLFINAHFLSMQYMNSLHWTLFGFPYVKMTEVLECLLVIMMAVLGSGKLDFE